MYGQIRYFRWYILNEANTIYTNIWSSIAITFLLKLSTFPYLTMIFLLTNSTSDLVVNALPSKPDVLKNSFTIMIKAGSLVLR